jgi:senataxin
MREYSALEGLEYYDLGKKIIQPQPTLSPKISSSTIQHYCERYDVNEPQAIAIISALQKKMGFSLIQGYVHILI